MYFDYTATTQIDKEILDFYIKVQNEYFANTTSLHKLGQIANNIYEESKNKINSILNTNCEVIYTSNATEANNLGILGYLKNKTGKVITSKIEHSSVYEVFKELERNGFEVVYIDVLENGCLDLKQFEKEINNNTILVSIMWVNNIVGSIQPIKEIIEIMKNYPKAKLHCDLVQGITKIKPNFSFSDIDIMSISSHKFYGPKGIGCLLYKKNISLSKILFGSTSQNGIKPGTFDLGLIVCLVKALEKYMNKQKDYFLVTTNLKNYLLQKLNNQNIKVFSDEFCSPYIISLSIKNNLSEVIARKLEEKNIYVGTGSSCNSKIKKGEKTILAMTKSLEFANSVIRISLSYKTTIEEIDCLVNVLNTL